MGALTEEQRRQKWHDIAKHNYVEKSKRLVRSIELEPFGLSTADKIRFHLSETIRALNDWEAATFEEDEDTEEEDFDESDLGEPGLL